MAAVLVVSLIAAVGLSSMFQRTAARPIVQLAQIAQMVSHEKKYSIRAPTTPSRNVATSVPLMQS